MDRKGIGSIISVSLLVVISVVAMVGFQTWTETYNAHLFSENEMKTNSFVFNNLDIGSLVGTYLYVKGKDLVINKVEVNNLDCNIANLTLSEGLNKVNLDYCLSEINDNTAEIVFYTDEGIRDKTLYLSKELDCKVNSEGYFEGSGTSEDPYKICNCKMLDNIKLNHYSNYILINNIDCSETRYWNNGAGFDPTYFGGDFNGNNYTIKGLYINRPGRDYVGLFSSFDGNIQDLTLDSFQIIGNNLVGSLAGCFNLSSSINIYNINVENLYLKGNNYVGGITGETTISCGNLNFSKVKVSGSLIGDHYVGGFIGYGG